MKYVAAVDRSSSPAYVYGRFNNKAKAIEWAKAQGGYNAIVYLAQTWQNVWLSK